MKSEKSVLFSLAETEGHYLTDKQKQICFEFLCGNISKDEYLSNILMENMSYLSENISMLCT